MPPMPMSEIIVLTLIFAAFAAFGLGLLLVSLYVTLGGAKTGGAVEREVTPARRVTGAVP